MFSLITGLFILSLNLISREGPIPVLIVLFKLKTFIRSKLNNILLSTYNLTNIKNCLLRILG